uniref:Alpha/beta hydrolase fold-3 domain-containing protein n=1 Tax=Ornithorhynchus anatinus TaxID=9258 RepID=F6WV88_ORNAN
SQTPPLIIRVTVESFYLVLPMCKGVIHAHTLTHSLHQGSNTSPLVKGDGHLFLLSLQGLIFEKMGLCSMAKFTRFMHDLNVRRQDPALHITNTCFGPVPVRVYQPKARAPGPRCGIIFCHGGGIVLGSLETHDLTNGWPSLLVSRYRLSPEHKCPTGLEDCLRASEHFLKTLKDYDVDPARLVAMGDSVGGSLATAICQDFVCRPGLPRLRAQVLIYPFLQGVDFQLPSFQQNQSVPPLNQFLTVYCVTTYLGVDSTLIEAVSKGAHVSPEMRTKLRRWLGMDNLPEKFTKGYRPPRPAPFREDVYQVVKQVFASTISPLLAEDDIISQLPETCLISCQFDSLRDDGLLYKKRLEDHGVPLTWHHMEDGFHGVINTFDIGLASLPCGKRILDLVVGFVKGL